MRQAYSINNIQFANGVVGDGTGQTIAIVAAYNYPTVFRDLDAFDQRYGATASGPSLYRQYGPASSILTVYDQNGNVINPTSTTIPVDHTGGWEAEEALDVQWAHAIAPRAKIDLIECNDDSINLLTGVKSAAKLPGVVAVSMSFDVPEFSGEQSYDGVFTTPAGHTGVTFVSGTGDHGAPGGYPACSPNVLAAGGTFFSPPLDANGDYTSEAGWSGSGGGISKYEPEPSYQTGVQSSGYRSIPDVSFDAGSCVSVFCSYPQEGQVGGPWWYAEGTSLATPCWAGLIAIVDQGRALRGQGPLDGATQTLPELYQLPSSAFHDITAGNNGDLAGPGYDLCTGLGSPVANLLVPDLAGYPTIGALTASPNAQRAGNELTLTANNVADLAGTVTSVAFYRESNGIAGLQTGKGGDTFVGTSVQSDGRGGWSVTISTAGLPSGTYTYYAQATDDLGTTSGRGTDAATTTNTIERQVTARPTLSISAQTVALGAGVNLTASAKLAGGYLESGTITFTLYSSTNVVLDTETVPVNGNGTYLTPKGYLPSAAGTYEWVASYSGDDNNTGARTIMGSAPALVLGPGVKVLGSCLYLVGGSGTSQITVNPYGASKTGSTGIEVSGSLNGLPLNNLDFRGIKTLELFGQGGTNTLTLASKLTVATVIYAAGGTNNLNLAAGNNIVVLGSGTDTVKAGNGNNLIVGGLGPHTLQAGKGSNILIDGTTANETNIAALEQAIADWAAYGDTSANVAAVTALLGPVTYNRAYANTLKASNGLDWFLWTYGPDTVSPSPYDE